MLSSLSLISKLIYNIHKTREINKNKSKRFNVIIGKKGEECDWGRWTDAEHEKFLDLIISIKTLNWKKVNKLCYFILIYIYIYIYCKV